ncbi:MAG TPA: hypothetical protein VFB61_08770 [Gemmatimonadales bacterium]|nr:hypothetical protein [Gemmatimonadales bacterium]
MRALLAGALLVGVLALPGMREALERVMATHMLVQIPLLAVAGAVAVTGLGPEWKLRIDAWNRGGVSGMLLALIASSWWMVPRALDLALASPAMELTKFVTLPLMVGVPLALSWDRLGAIGRGFVIANVLPMWAVVGWLYIVAPVRLCNFYLVEQQVAAGFGLLGASVVLGVAVGALAFRGVGSPSLKGVSGER